MRGKVLISICSLIIGAVGMFLFMSGPLAVVKAECPSAPGTPCGNGDVNGDGRIDMGDPIYLIHYLHKPYSPVPVPIVCPPGGQLPATGQTNCYDIVGSEISCDSTDYPGQDGYYQAGCPMEGRFVDNGDGTVTDNCTGLMWQQETADINGDGQISPDDVLPWKECLEYCDSLVFAEHDDWRLPNRRELESIVDCNRTLPATDPVFSAESTLDPSIWYWSSTTFPYFPYQAWYVNFNNGRVRKDRKSIAAYVRAVRGGL